MTKNSKNIVNALHGAECGHEVYEALSHVPTENLHDMLHMIETILVERIREKKK